MDNKRERQKEREGRGVLVQLWVCVSSISGWVSVVTGECVSVVSGECVSVVTGECVSVVTGECVSSVCRVCVSGDW